MGPFLLSLLLALTATIQGDADDAYAYISGLSEKGLNELVVKEAQTFLREHANHAKADHARYRLACALSDLGKRADAEPLLRDLSTRAQFEFAAESSLRYGRLRLAAGDAAAAETAFTRAMERGREYLVPIATALRADARLAKGDVAGARADYEAVLAKDPEGERAIEARIGLAWCAHKSGDAKDAVDRARKVLDARALPAERKGEVQCLLGEALLDAGRAREALDAWRSVRDPALADAAARGAGYAHAALGDSSAASREFARVVEEHPQSRFAAECALQCGIQRLNAKDAAGARAVLSMSVAGDGPEASYWRARAESACNDAQAALATLERALSKSPPPEWKSRLSAARGVALESLGRTDDAVRAYQNAGSVDALQAAAAASLAAGRNAQAADCAQKILEQNPPAEKKAPALLALGEARLADKRWKEGEQAFLAAAEIDPDPARRGRARLRAAWCRWLAEDAPGARAMFDAALHEKLGPEDAEEASYLRARAAEASGERDDGARLYREHLDVHPRGAHATEAVMHLSRLVDDPTAITLLADAVARAPKAESAAETRFELAERLSGAKRWKDAAARYREVVDSAPNAALAQKARYGLAWCAFETNAFEEAARGAESLFSESDVPDPLRAASLELALWARVRQGQPEQALETWKTLARAPIEPSKKLSAARTLVDACVKGGKYREAHAVLDDLDLNTKDPVQKARTQLVRARVLAGENRLDEAEAALVAASKLASRDAELRADALSVSFVLAEKRFDAGDDARAIQLYAAVAADPKNPLCDRALYKTGFARLRAKDAAGAEKDFARLIAEQEKSPLLHEALFLRGEALFRLDRLDDACACFERVRREAPRHAVIPKVLFRHGIALARNKHWIEATDTLGELARTKPDFENIAESELWRGRAVAQTGDPRGARAAFERVLAKDKGAFADRARIELGRLQVASSDLDGALAQFLKVAVLSADAEAVPEALWCAGDVLEKLGQRDQALDRYREIVTNHAKSEWAARAQERIDAARESSKRPAPSGN